MLVRKRPPSRRSWSGSQVDRAWDPEPVLWPHPTRHSNSSPTPHFIWIRDYSQRTSSISSPLWAFAVLALPSC